MSQEHDRIEELLAGHALDAVSAEDALEADRLLSEHVPSCPLCREALAGFRRVADHLALAATPSSPPEMVLAGLRRSLRGQPLAPRRRGAYVATAAGVAALVGIAALSASLGTRASRAESHLSRIAGLVDAISQPGATPVRLRADVDTTAIVEVSAPTLERMIVVGHDVPEPAPGFVYVIWLGSEAGFRPIGRLSPDADGVVYSTFRVNPSTFDRILITEERLDQAPVTPRADSPHVWSADLS